jgi:two-component system, NarL family, response regulator DesR
MPVRPSPPAAGAATLTHVIRVLLGQRGTLFRGALAAVLSSQRDLLVVAELADVDFALEAAARERPQVAVLDGALPGATTVVGLCRRLHQCLPACRPLVLLDRAASAGLSRSLIPLAPWLGLLATDGTPRELVQAVRGLAKGEAVLDAGLAAAAEEAVADNPLTERECEVLRLTRYGAPTKEIAKRLDLRVGTVRNYLSRGLTKTGARTPLEAIRIALAAGWI